MAGISDYLAKKILDEVFTNTNFVPPVTVYVSLHTADPVGTGVGEVVGGAYARVASTWGAAVLATHANATTADAVFPAATADWGTITHFGVWDALAAGNFLWGAILPTQQLIQNLDTAKFPAGLLTASLPFNP